MNKKLNPQMDQNRRFGIAAQEYDTEIAKLPNLVQLLIVLAGFNVSCEQFVTIIQKRSKAFTEITVKDKAALCDSIHLIMTRVRQYAIVNNNALLAKRAKTSISALKRMSTTQILAETEHALEIANQLSDKWEQIGITTDDIDDLANAKQKYNASLTEADKIRDQIKEANHKISTLLKENSQLIHQQIMPTIRVEFNRKNVTIRPTPSFPSFF